jgi:hypothetical protein
VFILEHYFASKSVAAVREAFSNAYPDKEVMERQHKKTGNKISEHRKCLSVTGAYRATRQLKFRPCRFQAMHQLQQRDTAARIQYYHWFREGVHM